MDLFDVVRSCFRRWYVVVPLLLITSWIAYSFYAHVKPVYYSNAVVSIAPPNLQVQYTGDGIPVPRNGLMDAGGATFITNLAVLAFGDPAVKTQVVAGGGKPDFVVRMFPPAVTGNGTAEQLPLIMIEATEGDQISAARTVELAAAQADPVLRNLQQQAGVPEDQMVKPLTVSPPMTVPGVPSRKRTTAAILGAGLGLAILAGVGADLSIIRRQERKRGRQGSDLRISDRTHSETEGYETKEHPRSADPASKVTTTSALRHE